MASRSFLACSCSSTGSRAIVASSLWRTHCGFAASPLPPDQPPQVGASPPRRRGFPGLPEPGRSQSLSPGLSPQKRWKLPFRPLHLRRAVSQGQDSNRPEQGKANLSFEPPGPGTRGVSGHRQVPHGGKSGEDPERTRWSLPQNFRLRSGRISSLGVDPVRRQRRRRRRFPESSSQKCRRSSCWHPCERQGDPGLLEEGLCELGG